MVDRVEVWMARLDGWSLRHRSTRIARRAVAGFMRHEALQYAGSMAYFGVLSIFQLLVLGVVVFSLLLGDERARAFVLEQVQAGSPLDPATINGVIDAVIESRGGITIVSGGFLLWSALGVFSSLSSGIERAFESKKARPFVQDKLIGLFLMAITGVLAVASLVIGIATGIVQDAAGDVLARVPGGGAALAAIGLVVPALLIFVAFVAIYRIVPNRHVSLGEVWPGALVAALLWTILRFGFTYYATQVAHYDSAFGPISTGVTLLVFLYFASVIVLLGAEVSRASATEDEPVPVPELETTRVVEEPAPRDTSRPRAPGWVLVLAAALAGVLAGRLSKRDRE
ncbi:MAG: YihY/virulence factor BrkB family protein [Chloroflexota bacterium]|nr:YihY/virulence factor BrkB family protein [Chloroflexota bacterium]